MCYHLRTSYHQSSLMGDKYDHTFFSKRRGFIKEFPAGISTNYTSHPTTKTAGRNHIVSLRGEVSNSREFVKKEW